MTTYANDAIKRISELDLSEEDLIQSPEVRGLVEPFVYTGPQPLKCSADRCRTTIAWVAVAADGRVEFAPDARWPRTVGTYADGTRIPATQDLTFPDMPAPKRFAAYIEWSQSPDSPVRLATNPDVEARYPLRFTFICPTCDKEYPFTNSKLLHEYLRSIWREWSEVRPGRI